MIDCPHTSARMVPYSTYVCVWYCPGWSPEHN